MRFGSKVWIRRGGGSPQGTSGCLRLVRGTLIGAHGTVRWVRLEEDDELDTVGWNKQGQIGHWSASVVTKRGEE